MQAPRPGFEVVASVPVKASDGDSMLAAATAKIVRLIEVIALPGHCKNVSSGTNAGARFAAHNAGIRFCNDQLSVCTPFTRSLSPMYVVTVRP